MDGKSGGDSMVYVKTLTWLPHLFVLGVHNGVRELPKIQGSLESAL